MTEFWPFFQPYFIFPIVVKVGLKSEPFEDEKSFLKFLKEGENSELIWMDHEGLQVVSNMYQISIHVLTTGVSGMDEPKARWTHIEPDSRLSSFSTVHKGLPDMWLMHVDEAHFDLLIRKNSDLVKEGSVDDLLSAKVNNKEQEVKQATANSDLGPGYMGWKVNDEPNDDDNAKEFKNEIAEIKEAYNAMKKEFEEIKDEFSKNENKQCAKFKLVIRGLKEDFKACMADLKKETLARNEAEIVVKVLKDTLEAERNLREEVEEMQVDNKSDNIDVDENEWNQQRKQKNKMKKRVVFSQQIIH